MCRTLKFRNFKLRYENVKGALVLVSNTRTSAVVNKSNNKVISIKRYSLESAQNSDQFHAFICAIYLKIDGIVTL